MSNPNQNYQNPPPQQGYNPNPPHAHQQHPPQYQSNNSKVAKTMNAVIVTGKYFSQKHNKEVRSYLTIGKLFIYANGGMSLKLDAYPTANQTINFYDIKPKNQNQPPPQYNQQQNYNSGGYG